MQKAYEAQKGWRTTPVKDRAAIITKFVQAFVAKKEEIALELTKQMGRSGSLPPSHFGSFSRRLKWNILDLDLSPRPPERSRAPLTGRPT